jgi:hypothetical protein
MSPVVHVDLKLRHQCRVALIVHRGDQKNKRKNRVKRNFFQWLAVALRGGKRALMLVGLPPLEQGEKRDP